MEKNEDKFCELNLSLNIFLLGTKHIDPDSGLIYFKYDFGYEFGIIFPGEGRKFIAGGNNVNSNAQLSKNKFLHNSAGVIDIPVLHENTIKQNLSNRNSIDFLQLHKKIAPNKLFRQPAIAINVDEFHNEQYNQNQQPLVRKGISFITSMCWQTLK